MNTKNEILTLCKENNLNFLYDFLEDYWDNETLDFEAFIKSARDQELNHEYIDGNVHIYNSDLWDFAKEDYFSGDFVSQAISEGFYDPTCKDFRLTSLFQAGHYLKLQNDLNEEIYKLSEILESEEA